jgi:hypothetical protein
MDPLVVREKIEKNFWDYVNNMIAKIGKGKATISEPETVTEQQM